MPWWWNHHQIEDMTLQDKLNNITIALAGIIQAASLVNELAKTGKLDETAYEASIYSLFQTDPKDLPAIYNGLTGIRYGLEKLTTLFQKTTTPIPLRYMLSLMHLQKKISRSPNILNALTQRIEQAKKQVNYFSLMHPTVIANLADTYLSTISTFKFRIVVWGSQRILTAPDNMEKIRALLLAGIRSSVLWRQMGGSRLQLLFFRAKIKATAEKMLARTAT
ncbi:MAG: High frequency lysogenization protein hflD-like protein [uncultured bacterium]|nr:MAG: High frequency lysogenization protein hflD-like protein [uncultured bacterium]